MILLGYNQKYLLSHARVLNYMMVWENRCCFELITNHSSWIGNKELLWGVRVEIETDLVVFPFLVYMYRSFIIWEWYQVRGSLSLLYYIAVLRILVVYDRGHFVFCQKNLNKYYAFPLPFNTLKRTYFSLSLYFDFL